MKRFENAQVGDKVYCRKYGFGNITYINIGGEARYPVDVAFDNKGCDTYTTDGYLDIEDAEPILFYSDGINNYLTERPEAETEVHAINWNDYEDEEIEVYHAYLGSWEKRRLIKYLPEKQNPFICENGQDSEQYIAFREAQLIEEKEPEIDWTLVPVGTQVTCVVGDSISFFMAYLPHLDYQFWVYDSSVRTDVAVGYKQCKLAEPVKPEWLKK